MIYQKGHLARPLDAVLSAPSRVAVLRQLFRSRQALTGRMIGKLAGINHQGAALALGALHELGIVQRSKSERASYWTLDRGNWSVRELLSPLFEREAEHAEQLMGVVKGAFYGVPASVLLGGSAARSRFEANEPLELVVVPSDLRRANAANQAIRALAVELRAQWGLKLKGTVLTKEDSAPELRHEMLWQLLPEEGPMPLATLWALRRQRAA